MALDGSTALRPRETSQGSLALSLKDKVSPLVLEGPLGVGKSFVARLTVAQCLQDESGSALVIYWGWGEREAPAGGREREVAVWLSSTAEWLDVMAVLSDRKEVTLPADLTLPMLLSTPRHLKGELLKACRELDRLVIIVDKFDSVALNGLSQEDCDALLEVQDKGAQLLLEVRDGDVPEGAEAVVATVGAKERIVLAKMDEEEAKATVTWECARLGRETLGEKAEYLDTVVALVGGHPGSIKRLVESTDHDLQEKGLVLDRPTAYREAALRASKRKYFSDYLYRRWWSLKDGERLILAVVAVAEEAGKSYRDVLNLWVRASEGWGLEQRRLEAALDRVLARKQLVVEVGEGGDLRVDGLALRDFILQSGESGKVRKATGIRSPGEPEFDWVRFLGWWLLGAIWFLLVTAVGSVSRWDPTVPWLLGGWAMAFVSAIGFWLRQFFPRSAERLAALTQRVKIRCKSMLQKTVA